MPEKTPILIVSTITDDDTGMYCIGEVDGIFQKGQLLKHLQTYGITGKNDLLTHLAFLQHQVISEWFELITPDEQSQEAAKSPKK